MLNRARMPRPPRPSPIAPLIATLASPDAGASEIAVARLRLLGPLAVPRLLELVRMPDASPLARAHALRVLASAQGSDVVVAAVPYLRNSDPKLVEAACELLGAYAARSDQAATPALDALAGMALSQDVPPDKRLLAVAAIEGLPPSIAQPLLLALAKTPSPMIARRANGPRPGTPWSLEMLESDALPDSAALVAAVVAVEAGSLAPKVLKKAIDAVRTKEQRAVDDERENWCGVRAALHDALARRGSRIALYDIRETFDVAARPLPIGFLSAATAIGDLACLGAIANAWASASDRDTWYRDHLRDVFTAIVEREGIARDHSALRKILTRHPHAATLVAAAPNRNARRRRQ